jgi:hypothetical protein
MRTSSSCHGFLASSRACLYHACTRILHGRQQTTGSAIGLHMLPRESLAMVWRLGKYKAARVSPSSHHGERVQHDDDDPTPITYDASLESTRVRHPLVVHHLLRSSGLQESHSSSWRTGFAHHTCVSLLAVPFSCVPAIMLDRRTGRLSGEEDEKKSARRPFWGKCKLADAPSHQPHEPDPTTGLATTSSPASINDPTGTSFVSSPWIAIERPSCHAAPPLMARGHAYMGGGGGGGGGTR